jgi:hypothetical protein
LPPKPVVFGEGAAGIVVVIDLVGGDHENRRPGRMGVDRIEEHTRADDIGAPGLLRVADGATHQCLGRHVQHEIGFGGLYETRHRVRIADIGDMAVGLARDIGQLEKRRPGFGRKPRTGHLRAHGREPQRRPTALEPGMAGQQDAFALPEGRFGFGGGQGLITHQRPHCGRWVGPANISIFQASAYQPSPARQVCTGPGLRYTPGLTGHSSPRHGRHCADTPPPPVRARDWARPFIIFRPVFTAMPLDRAFSGLAEPFFVKEITR